MVNKKINKSLNSCDSKGIWSQPCAEPTHQNVFIQLIPKIKKAKKVYWEGSCGDMEGSGSRTRQAFKVFYLSCSMCIYMEGIKRTNIITLNRNLCSTKPRTG